MFRRVVGALFKASASQEKKQSPSIVLKPARSQGNSISLMDDIFLSSHDTAFLDYLFGESSQKEGSDPFSDYISEQLERVLISPKVMLNELPVMPASVTTLITELQNDEFNVEALLEVIESEPSMAADVIKLANSARYRRSERQVTDLKTAFMNMGAKGLIEGVIDAYVKNFTPSFNIYWRHFGENIWQHSVQTANFSKELVKNTELASEEATAYFVGLIRNLGRMVTFQIMIEAFRHVDPDASPNSSAFKKLIYGYETRLTFAIAHFWKLPEPVLVALAFQASKKLKSTPLGLVVFEANYLSELQCLLREQSIDADTFKQRCQRNLSSSNARQIASRLISEAEEKS